MMHGGDTTQPQTSLRGLTGSDYCPASSNRKKLEVINGDLLKLCLHPFHSHPAAATGAVGGPSSKGAQSQLWRAEGELGIKGCLQEDGIFSCIIFPLKEKNMHSQSHKSQPRS